MSERLAAPWRSTLKRWLKFSMVGVMGVGVQLGVLATLTSLGLHYLVATVQAHRAGLPTPCLLSNQ